MDYRCVWWELMMGGNWRRGSNFVFGSMYQIVYVICNVPVSYTHLDVYKRQQVC